MKHLNTLLIGLTVLTSCNVNKPLTSAVKPTELADIQAIEPKSFIYFIETGNKTIYNDSLSREASKFVLQSLRSFPQNIPITGEIGINDIGTKTKIYKEVENLCNAALKQKTVVNLKLTPAIDSLLDSKNKRFGIFAISTGFTRDKGNYGGQVAKGLLTSIATLGMYSQSPVKAASTIYILIADAKENNVAFFRRTYQQDEPLKQKALDKQIKSLFEGYFWEKSSSDD